MHSRRPSPPNALPRSLLGKTGYEVSLLGFGAEAIGRSGRTFEAAKATLEAVLDFGATLIDTASAYGNSEEFIGRALADRHRRGEFTLVTKCGWVNPDYSPAWSAREISDTIDQSLRRLRMECLDVLLLHSCELQMLQRGEVIDAVTKARDAGKARFIGYSGDNQVLQFAIDCGAFNVIECSFNILDQANREAIETAAGRGIGVLLKRPMANAVPGATARPRSDYAAQYWPRWQAIGLADRDFDGVPPLEAALRFSAYQKGVSCVLIGSSNAEHMRDNARWLEQGPLTTRMVTRLREAFAKAGEAWEALG